MQGRDVDKRTEDRTTPTPDETHLPITPTLARITSHIRADAEDTGERELRRRATLAIIVVGAVVSHIGERTALGLV